MINFEHYDLKLIKKKKKKKSLFISFGFNRKLDNSGPFACFQYIRRRHCPTL